MVKLLKYVIILNIIKVIEVIVVTNIEKYEKWLEMAEDDIDTALVMHKCGKYTYVSFMCQQALEKLCKGIYVYTFNKEAPFTHNINVILKDIDKVTNSNEYKKYEPLFATLTSFYIIGRYDVYKQKISKNLDAKSSKELLNKSKEAFKWLKSLQT